MSDQPEKDIEDQPEPEVPEIKVPTFPNERKFQAWFVKTLRKEFGEKIVVTPITGTGYGASGVSDLIICFYGIFFACELKMNGRKLSRLQLMYCMNIDRAGGRTLSPVTPASALQAIDYFRTIEQFRMGRSIVQSLSPDEAQEVVDEANAVIAQENTDEQAKTDG